MYLAELKNKKSCRAKVEISFDCEYDVVVAGLGTAGAISAISAAENGAAVLGVEKCTLSGGSATAGGIASYYYGLEGGRFEQVDEEANQIREGNFVNGGLFHHDAKAIALDRAMVAAGVKISYQATVIGVYLDDLDNITGIRLVSPEGVQNIACKVLLDASGDGEICAMAGAEYEEGRPVDGQSQPYSSVRITAGDEQIGWANFDAGYATASDGADMTRAVIAGNSLHLVPEGERMYEMLWIATMPGLREGRLIKCDEYLTFADYLNGKRPSDPVAYCYSNFDSHSKDWAFEDDLTKDWMVTANLWCKNVIFPVPLECMIVKGLNNLMVVGRCLSVDHIMACALRMQRGMQKLGQAAGTAAAMAVAGDCGIRSIDRNELKKRLEKDGCLAEPDIAKEYAPENSEELKKTLQSDDPSEAIWYLSRNIQKYQEEGLKEFLNASDKNLSYHCALALGIAGRKEALPVLKKIVQERDDFIAKTARPHHNTKRICGAVHLLGKFIVEENIAVLLDYLDKTLEARELSMAVMSLLRLGDAFVGRRQEIAQALTQLFKQADFECELLLKDSSDTQQKVSEQLEKLLMLLAVKQFKSWGIDNNLLDFVKEPLTWRERQLLKQIAS
jgi:FAD-dependent oxidoreductase family protein